MDKQTFLDALPIIGFIAFFLFKGQILGAIFRFKNLSAKDALDYKNKHPEAILVDVRTNGEFASGHLEGALNIPLGGVKEGIQAQGVNKETPILLICASGSRSSSAALSLKFSGYKNVYNINGGMMMASRLKA